jgi:hypothetical protein
MNSERSQAYGQVMKTIEDFGGAKLHPDEQQVVRDAADALLFCEDLEADAPAAEALDAFHRLIERLLDGDRIASETAGRITADVEACGPLAPIR